MATTSRVAAVLTLLLGAVAAAPGVGTAQQHIHASPHAAPTLDLEVFTLPQLKALDDPGTLRRLRHAVFNTGMLAVDPRGDAPPTTTQPSTRSPTSAALEALVRCASDHQLDDMTRAVTLADGSTRTTLATSTNHSVPQPLPSTLQSRCPALLPPASKVRGLASEAGLAYAAALDALVHGPGLSPLQLKRRGLDSFAQAVVQGESLEHFHTFTRPQGGPQRPSAAPATAAASESQATAALHMHTDIGLFIVMTAAQYFEASYPNTTPGDEGTGASKVWRQAGEPEVAEGDDVTGAGAYHPPAGPPPPHPGLYLELPSGLVVRPLFPAGSLLVMNGEAGSKWMRAIRGVPLPPAAPHEVVLPTDMRGRVRAWYGRMFFPLADARLQDRDELPTTPEASQTPALSFGSYRTTTMAAFQSGQQHMASALGCGATRRLLQDQGACAAGQVFCWMTCMDIPSDATCSKDQIQCKNPAGQLWPADFPLGDQSHCFDCQLTCPYQNVTLPTEGFCNTQVTPITMWMTGFQFATSSASPCVAFLFREWPLNSRVKFAFACIGTFLVGVASAALGHARAQLLRSRLGGPPTGHTADAGDEDGLDGLESGRGVGGDVQGNVGGAPKVQGAARAAGSAPGCAGYGVGSQLGTTKGCGASSSRGKGLAQAGQPSGCPCPASWGRPLEAVDTQVQGSPVLAAGAPAAAVAVTAVTELATSIVPATVTIHTSPQGQAVASGAPAAPDATPSFPLMPPAPPVPAKYASAEHAAVAARLGSTALIEAQAAGSMLISPPPPMAKRPLQAVPFLHRPEVWKLTHLAGETLLFAVQMTVAYFLMLIAMTYEAELFIAVVLGLAAGHGALLYHQGEQEAKDGRGTQSLVSHDRRQLEDVVSAQRKARARDRQGGMVNPEPCCSFA